VEEVFVFDQKLWQIGTFFPRRKGGSHFGSLSFSKKEHLLCSILFFFVPTYSLGAYCTFRTVDKVIIMSLIPWSFSFDRGRFAQIHPFAQSFGLEKFGVGFT
jgi:hypothetical protein